MLASEIANKLGYEIVGADYDICGISWSAAAKKDEVAIVKREREINATMARVVLTKPIITQTNKTLLVTFENIECSFVRICKLLMDTGVLKDYTETPCYTLHRDGYYIGKNCHISNKAIIQPGAVIGDDVTISENCRIDSFVTIGSGCVLEKGVYIGAGSKIGASSFYHYYSNGQIMKFDGCGRVKIGKYTCIGCNTIIQRGTISDTIIGDNNMIGNIIDIGHDVVIGNNCKIVSQTGIAGDVLIKDNVTIYGQVGISNNVIIGNNAVIKGRTIISKSVAENEIVYGPFGRKYFDELRLIVKARKFFEERNE